MSYKSKKKTFFLSGPFVISVALFFLIFFVANIFLSSPKKLEIPHIRSKEYIWPEGCENKIYKLYDSIGRGCVRNYYTFNEEKKYGLPAYKSSKYYRVDRNLVQITCGFKKECGISHIYYDVFYQ